MYKNKLFVAVLALFLLVSTTGCFGGKDSPSDVSNEKSYQGEITELPTSIGGLDVTHVLITQAKDRVYLRSILFDLDQYMGQSVRVHGNYYEEKISGSPVDVLTVNQIDILGDASNSAELQTYASSNLGVEFVYDANLFEVKDSSSTLSLSNAGSGVDSITIKVFKATPELDAQLYIDNNYDESQFRSIDDVTDIGSLRGFTNFGEDGISKTVFVFTFSQYVYEVATFSNSLDIVESMLTTLDSINYTGAPKAKLEEVSEVVSDVDSNEDENSNAAAQADGASTNVTSRFQAVIDRYLPTVTAGTPISFSFTDNGYFYFVYQSSSSAKRRSLVRYNDTSFQTVAEFETGDKETWKLVSGDNLVYDRPQTLIMVGTDSGSREVEVKQGYRYFESIPLGFGLQYPQDWYYARVENSYTFSDKPLEESAALVTVMVNTSSSSLPSVQNENGRIIYNVKVEGGFVTVSGPQSYEIQVRTMAETIVDLAN